MQLLRTSDSDFEQRIETVVRDRRESDVGVAHDVSKILAKVRDQGDAAIADYTRRFDDHVLDSDDDWQIPLRSCEVAYDALEPDLRDALEMAADRIRAYHAAQLPEDRDYTDGIGMRLGARWLPVD
ncbi:MAG: histidinol dehydrogenase, partial [Citromicrobium sp.]